MGGDILESARSNVLFDDEKLLRCGLEGIHAAPEGTAERNGVQTVAGPNFYNRGDG